MADRSLIAVQLVAFESAFALDRCELCQGTFGIRSKSLSRAIRAMADFGRVVIRQAYYALALITHNAQGVTVFDLDDAASDRPLGLPGALTLGPAARRTTSRHTATKHTEKKCDP